MPQISNYENSKWRTTAIFKIVISVIFRLNIIRFWWNLEWDYNETSTKHKILKSHMADGRCTPYLKNRPTFLAITLGYKFVRFAWNFVQRRKIRQQRQSNVKNFEFWKFETKDGLATKCYGHRYYIVLSNRSVYRGIGDNWSLMSRPTFVLTLWSDNSALSTVTQFRCLRSCSLELSTSSHSQPVFITILFLQPCQDWIIYQGLWR